jgi:hypothetical protein
MSILESGSRVPRAFNIRVRPLVSERRRKFTNFQWTWALVFVVAVDDPLGNTFVFHSGEETGGILHLIIPGFKDSIFWFLLPTKIHPSTHSRFWFLEDTNSWARSEIMAFIHHPPIGGERRWAARLSRRDGSACFANFQYPAKDRRGQFQNRSNRINIRFLLYRV